MRRLLEIAPDETSFARRGFEACDDGVRERLERIGRVFVDGYRMAMEVREDALLATTLDETFDSHHVGFAFEGAGFYLALLDVLRPWRRARLRRFTEEAARQHDQITTVGAGFALARLPWGGLFLPRYLRRLDATLAWCVPDGYGFHQGFFHPQRYVQRREAPPNRWPAYARRLFDAGLGRSLWWVDGAEPERIRRSIERFPPPRRADLWCGVGLACAYAGGVEDSVVRALPGAAGSNRGDLLSGVPFAASLRCHGSNPSSSTEGACQILLDATAEEAAAWVERARQRSDTDLSEDDPHRGGQIYLGVRRHLARHLAEA